MRALLHSGRPVPEESWPLIEAWYRSPERAGRAGCGPARTLAKEADDGFSEFFIRGDLDDPRGPARGPFKVRRRRR